MSRKIKLIGSITYYKSSDASGLVVQHIPSYTIFTIADESWASMFSVLQRVGSASGVLSEKDINELESESVLPLKSFLYQNGILNEVRH